MKILKDDSESSLEKGKFVRIWYNELVFLNDKLYFGIK